MSEITNQSSFVKTKKQHSTVSQTSSHTHLATQIQPPVRTSTHQRDGICGAKKRLRTVDHHKQPNLLADEFGEGTWMSQELSKWLVNGLFHLLINGTY